MIGDPHLCIADPRIQSAMVHNPVNMKVSLFVGLAHQNPNNTSPPSLPQTTTSPGLDRFPHTLVHITGLPPQFGASPLSCTCRRGWKKGKVRVFTVNTAKFQTTASRPPSHRRAPARASIDSLAPGSIFPACGAGWGPLRRLAPAVWGGKGQNDEFRLQGFVVVQAGPGRPNCGGWSQGRAGTFPWRQGIAEMGGGAGL